jgi:hypothetical protein
MKMSVEGIEYNAQKKKKGLPELIAYYVTGRQGGGRDIMRDNECNNETGKNRFGECHLG